MNSTLIVAKREFKSNFDSPIGYVVIGLTLIGVGILFFRDYWTVNRASLAPLFSWLPWVLAFFVIPAVTMRLFSEEKRSGTLELLITMPIRDREVVIGKYLATLGVIAVLLLLTLTYPVSIGYLTSSLDWGPIFTGYIGILLYSSAGIAIGLFFSSMTENQIVAFMLTFFVFAVLVIIDYVSAGSTGFIGELFSFVSFQRRLSPFGRGLVDIRHVFFFISVAIFFLLLTIRQLESRKWK